MTAPTDFVIDLAVRWSDMDAFSHVNHAWTVTILEEARAEWLASAPRLAHHYVVRELRVSYQGQIRHSDSPLRVTVRTSAWNDQEFTVDYEVRLAGTDARDRPAVVAQTVLGVDGPESGPHALSAADIAFVQSFAAASAGADIPTERDRS